MSSRKTLWIECKPCSLIMWGDTPDELEDKWHKDMPHELRDGDDSA